jgi:hypothetical protein
MKGSGKESLLYAFLLWLKIEWGVFDFRGRLKWPRAAQAPE